MISFIRSLWNKISLNDCGLFDVEVEKQRIFLESLTNPQDDIQRSYNQYCSQQFFVGRWKKILLNIMAFPLILMYYLKSYKKPNRRPCIEAVAILDGKDSNIIPLILRNKFSSWHHVFNSDEGVYFSKEDKEFFRLICREYPFSWLFLLKCLIKIGIYSNIVSTYNPKAIVVCNEYSFTSSVLTLYCEQNNIEHIDVMHGEKMFYIRDSFFRYHNCFVWNEKYISLFKQLKAYEGQFIVALPESMKFSMLDVKPSIDYTYYLGDEGKKEIEQVVHYLTGLSNSGCKVAIRPHPRYTNSDDVKSIGSSIEIEDCQKVDIRESILRTKNVVSLYSTVLSQAYQNGVAIVIDDLSRPEMYKKLKDLQYIGLQFKHKLLSQII